MNNPITLNEARRKGVIAYVYGKTSRVPLDIVLAGNDFSEAYMEGWNIANLADDTGDAELDEVMKPLTEPRRELIKKWFTED